KLDDTTTLTAADLSNYDIYVASWDRDNKLRWAFSYGEANVDETVTAVGMDASGILVVAGTFGSTFNLHVPNPFFDPVNDPEKKCGPKENRLTPAGAVTPFLAAFDLATGKTLWAQVVNLGFPGLLTGIASDPRPGSGGAPTRGVV